MYIIPQMKLLTTTEAAARLNISTRRVRALIAKGRLPAYLHGRDWLIFLSLSVPLRVKVYRALIVSNNALGLVSPTCERNEV